MCGELLAPAASGKPLPDAQAARKDLQRVARHADLHVGLRPAIVVDAVLRFVGLRLAALVGDAGFVVDQRVGAQQVGNAGRHVADFRACRLGVPSGQQRAVEAAACLPRSRSSRGFRRSAPSSWLRPSSQSSDTLFSAAMLSSVSARGRRVEAPDSSCDSAERSMPTAAAKADWLRSERVKSIFSRSRKRRRQVALVHACLSLRQLEDKFCAEGCDDHASGVNESANVVYNR